MPRSYALRVIVVFFIAGSIVLLSHYRVKNPEKQTLGISEKTTVSPEASAVLPSESILAPTTISPNAATNEYFQVTRVIDGDTIVVQMAQEEQTVRLIGVNTPESVDPRRSVECFGIEASNKAKELLAGRRVALSSDPTQADRDKYGRLLRYVTRDDGIFVNKWLIEEGYAYEYTYQLPYQYQEAFKKAQSTAQSEKKGLWGDPVCSNQNIDRTLESQQKPIGFIDKDCGDFSSRQEAQTFYESQGGPTHDVHKLDVDKNGLACESLP